MVSQMTSSQSEKNEVAGHNSRYRPRVMRIDQPVLEVDRKLAVEPR